MLVKFLAVAISAAYILFPLSLLAIEKRQVNYDPGSVGGPKRTTGRGGGTR